MTVVLELPAELETQFQEAAQKRGMSVQEFLVSAGKLVASSSEDSHLSAIRKLSGFARGSQGGSAAIRRERDEDVARDERDWQERHGQES